MPIPIVVGLDKIVSHIFFWFYDFIIPCTHCGYSREKQVTLFFSAWVVVHSKLLVERRYYRT